tara:strand:+ start:149 stop:520 length:372 start_codon:yes stop_codon:yes gene_type:complete
MAYFAKIGLNSEVIDVLAVHNNELLNSDGVEQEQLGINFLTTLTGHSLWVQTSYNHNIRKNYAGIGYTYDETRDAFIAPKPYSSWILNETTCKWESPVDKPNDGKIYIWNEETTAWDIFELGE